MRTWSNWDGTSISIHAPPRGATESVGMVREKMVFQFTPLREGRPDQQGDARETCYFNSRPSARGDLCMACAGDTGISFQFTPLREGRREPSSLKSALSTQFQFTPLREGRPGNLARSITADIISIHAPPRGATTLRGLFKSDLSISIHAPPRGATNCEAGGSATDHFNSRPSARGDPAVLRVVFLPFVFQFTPLREGRR